MTVERILAIFRRNQRIVVITEYGEVLFNGFVWWLKSKYVLSSLVTDIYRQDYKIYIVVAD